MLYVETSQIVDMFFILQSEKHFERLPREKLGRSCRVFPGDSPEAPAAKTVPVKRKTRVEQISVLNDHTNFNP